MWTFSQLRTPTREHFSPNSSNKSLVPTTPSSLSLRPARRMIFLPLRRNVIPIPTSSPVSHPKPMPKDVPNPSKTNSVSRPSTRLPLSKRSVPTKPLAILIRPISNRPNYTIFSTITITSSSNSGTSLSTAINAVPISTNKNHWLVPKQHVSVPIITQMQSIFSWLHFFLYLCTEISTLNDNQRQALAIVINPSQTNRTL